MDYQLCLFYSTSFLFIILTFKFLFTKSRLDHRLPPGPWKLPIIGSLHHLARSPLPHRVARDLSRKYGSIMHLQLGEISTVVISSPRLAEEIMKNHDIVFADRPTIVASEIMFYNKLDIGFAPYGPYWREMRKICALELFGPKSILSFGFIRQQEVSSMIDSIRSSIGLPINLSERLLSLTNSVVCRAAFGTNTTSQSELLSMISEAFLYMAGFDIADLFPSLGILHGLTNTRSKLNFMHQKLDEFFDKIISKRREKSTHPIAGNGHEGEDLLDVLLALQQSRKLDFPFTDTNVKAVIFVTNVHRWNRNCWYIDEWIMAEMLKNPKVMAKAQAEIREGIKGDAKSSSYLKLIIKEALRLHPPVPFLVPRESREASEIDGYNLPKKTRVLINAWAIGRDPNVWEDAEKFIPERFANSSIDFMGNNFEFIPFGAGRRMCPGISFSTAIVELALVELLYHFNWSLPDGLKPEDLDMTETSGITAARKNKLYAIAVPYNTK